VKRWIRELDNSWPSYLRFLSQLRLCTQIFSRVVKTNDCKSVTSINFKIISKIENVAINDVLPLKAARRDAIANSKRFGGLRHQRSNFDGYICIHYAAPPYSARISAIYFLPFGNVCLGSREKHNAEFTKGG